MGMPATRGYRKLPTTTTSEAAKPASGSPQPLTVVGHSLPGHSSWTRGAFAAIACATVIAAGNGS
jgi:hypothetical protein